MIENSKKARHQISNGKIRSLYGHSLSKKITKKAGVPPNILFHGTDPKYLPSIKIQGLLPMGRQYVHLSTDIEIAKEVGKRKASKPVVLTIMAETAHKNGIKFYEGNELVWLVDKLIPKFIDV